MQKVANSMELFRGINLVNTDGKKSEHVHSANIRLPQGEGSMDVAMLSTLAKQIAGRSGLIRRYCGASSVINFSSNIKITLKV